MGSGIIPAIPLADGVIKFGLGWLGSTNDESAKPIWSGSAWGADCSPLAKVALNIALSDESTRSIRSL